MKRFVLSALVTGLFLGLTATAGAADEKKKKKNAAPDLAGAFGKLDTNSDGKVSKDEFNAFKGLTAQKAGKEAKEPKGLADARNTWFTKLDTNSDGLLSIQEFNKAKDVIAANPLAAKKKKAK